MQHLYNSLIRYGLYYKLRLKLDVYDFLEQLDLFEDLWVQYNPRKNIRRKGLSLTSLDGGMSGYPDLDSIREYNQTHNIKLDENSFKTKTMAWSLVDSALDSFGDDVSRTHVIKHEVGGCFPPHRDSYTRELSSFRLFIPIKNCNPPNNYFILDERILHFDHGHVYFIDTCKEHTVFTTGSSTIFVVSNIQLSEKSVDNVLGNMEIT